MTRARSPIVLFAICTFVASARLADAAPTNKKKCIDHAETGQQLRASGKLIDARSAFAMCTATDCPAPVRKDCARWMDELDAATPTYSVKLEDETGTEVATGSVTVDDQMLVRSADGRAQPLDPGTHHFVWKRDAGGDISEDVVLHEGERNRVVLLHAPFADGVVTTTTSNGGVTTTSVSPAHKSVLPYILGGAGVVLGGVGAAFWGIGLSERSNLESTCANAHLCSDGDVSSSRSKLIVGDVMVGVGLVAIAGAVYMLVRGHDGDHASASAAGAGAADAANAATARSIGPRRY